MSEKETPKTETFSQRMARLREKADEISGGFEKLFACKEAGNLKQIAYWVGKISHDVSDLCKECLGEELMKDMKRKKGRIIH